MGNNVSIIVITYNNPTIFECLKSARNQIDDKDEIIVVDDHSTETCYITLQEYCTTYGITLVRAKKHGNRAYNRNLGAAKAINPILIFLDADILLLDASIAAIKIAYATKPNVAYIGTRCAGRYDPLRMLLFTGVEIQETAQQSIQLDFLTELPSVRDSRVNLKTYTENLPEQKYYWIYYYSCCCTVLKELFNRLGGFDESYVGWGVEDIDLGYRISLTGTISFLQDFRGIHIPHERTLISAEQDNCRNLKRMLKKIQRFDIEFIAVYRVSAEHLVKIKEVLNRMQMLRLPVFRPEKEVNVLYINSVSLNAPYGQMIYCDSTGSQEVFELLGMATFFESKSISKVIVSSGILLYPASIICGILQEALRIGERVFLEGPLPSFRLDWSGFPNIALLQPQKRNEYRIHDMMELQFEKVLGKDSYLVTSDYLELETTKDVPLKLPIDQNNITAPSAHTYCVINLTRGTGYKLLIKQLAEAYCLRYAGVYSLSNVTGADKPCTKFPEHLCGLLTLCTPILLIVESLEHFCFSFSMWEERNHPDDIIVDFEGRILHAKLKSSES